MKPGEPIPRLIPAAVYEYAERLGHGTLSERGVPTPGYAADDPKMLPYLRAVVAGDEPDALRILANSLAASPLLLWHPYTQSTIHHLFMLFSQFADQPKTFRDHVNRALDDFIVAWGYGVTGRDVAVRTSYAKRGRTPDLFPSLDDRDGWDLTPEAQEQRRDAARFVEHVEYLKTRLASGVRWRDLRNQYRESEAHGKASVVEETAQSLGRLFAEVLRAWNQSASPPSPEATRAVARKALAVPRGRNPNDTAAYEFLALYPIVVSGRGMRLTPSLIKNTMETLTKRGIPPRF